jgi:basic membrane protein A and related proteins
MIDIRRFALPLLLACALAACGAREDAAPADAVDSLKVALLTGGPVSDAGWYAGGYEGLLMIRDSLGASVSHQQTRTAAEYDEAFRAYAAEGYDIVFAHGNEYQDAAIRAGEQYPELTIVVSGGGRVARNVVPVIFRLEQASYMAGMVAGGVTRSNVVGMVGGMEIPSAQGTFRAFEAGAKAVNPNVQVLETFIGSWDDVAAAKEAAVAQIRRGADVVIHNTDAASFGVFQAVREAVAGGKPTWAMGMNADQNDVAPDVILGSAVIRIPQAFLDVARKWQAGEVGGAPVYVNLAEEVVEYVPNAALLDRVPAELMTRVDSARAQIRRGELEVPRVPYVEGEPGVSP